MTEDKDELEKFIVIMLARKGNLMDASRAIELYHGLRQSTGSEKMTEYVQSEYQSLKQKWGSPYSLNARYRACISTKRASSDAWECRSSLVNV